MKIKINRYPGPRNFTEKDKTVFCGRERETDELSTLITKELAVLLYSKSGLGKSSLLNAGVIPYLEEYSFGTPFKAFHFRFFFEQKETPLNSVKKIIEKELGFEFPAETKLWECISELTKKQPANIPLLVFDQFEQLFDFTDDDIDIFLSELSEVIHPMLPNRVIKEIIQNNDNSEEIQNKQQPLVHAVFVMRSDKLEYINEKVIPYIPQIRNNEYNLKPLTYKQAKDAIKKPATDERDIFLSERFEINDDVIELIIDTLKSEKQKYIESTHLQMVCQAIEKKKIEERTIDVNTFIRDRTDIEKIIEEFYNNGINLIVDEYERNKAKDFIEENLIKGKTRSCRTDKEIEHLNKDTIKLLVDATIIRREPSQYGESAVYELTHDSLIEAVAKSREIKINKQKQKADEDKLKSNRKLTQKYKLFMWGAVIVAILIGASFYKYYINQQKIKQKEKQYSGAELIDALRQFSEGNYILAKRNFQDIGLFDSKQLEDNKLTKEQLDSLENLCNEGIVASDLFYSGDLELSKSKYFKITKFCKYINKDSLASFAYTQIGNCEKSQTVFVEFDQLNPIKEQIFEINLPKRNLATLPKEIALYKNVRRVYISDNQFNKIPGALVLLKDLQILDLSQNKIIEIDSTITRLDSLRFFSINNNNIKKIPNYLSNLKKLHTIAIKNNSINSIEQLKCQMLSTIILTDNPLGKFPISLLSLPSIRDIELFNANITELPSPIMFFPSSIKSLGIRQNRISKDKKIPIYNKNNKKIRFY